MKVSSTSLAPGLNFTKLKQQRTIKSVRFWHSLPKHLAAHWSLYQETPLRLLSQANRVVVPTVAVLNQSGRHIFDSDAAAAEMSLVRGVPTV